MRYILAIALILCAASAWGVTTYELVEEKTVIPQEEKQETVTAYYATVYVNGNKLADGIPVMKDTAKTECENYIKAYNASNGTKFSATLSKVSE